MLKFVDMSAAAIGRKSFYKSMVQAAITIHSWILLWNCLYSDYSICRFSYFGSFLVSTWGYCPPLRIRRIFGITCLWCFSHSSEGELGKDSMSIIILLVVLWFSCMFFIIYSAKQMRERIKQRETQMLRCSAYVWCKLTLWTFDFPTATKPTIADAEPWLLRLMKYGFCCLGPYYAASNPLILHAYFLESAEERMIHKLDMLLP